MEGTYTGASERARDILSSDMPMRLVIRGARRAILVRRRMRGLIKPSWEAEFEAWARVLHHYAKRSSALPLAVQRGALASMPKLPLPRDVREERVVAGTVPGRIFRVQGASDRWLYYLHGGGYSIGSVDTHRDLILRLARAAGANAFAIDYRLAPEHTFPAALDDAVMGWHWLRQRVDPSRVVLAGESAGGGLSLATAVSLRDAGEPLPAGVVAISPWADLTLSGASIDANARFDYIARPVLEIYVRRYAPRDPAHPLVSPVNADLRGLPPLLVQAGDAEALHDDAVLLAERAEAAGVPTRLRIYADMIHVWHMFPIREANEAVREIGEFAREVVTGPTAERQAS